MKALVDTNVILDIALKRDPFCSAAVSLLKVSEQKGVRLYVTATTITDLYYIIRRARDKATAYSFLRDLLSVFEVAAVGRQEVLAALDSDVSDFEDAVQSAVARQEAIDTIITRNGSDFSKAGQTIHTPASFLDTLE